MNIFFSFFTIFPLNLHFYQAAIPRDKSILHNMYIVYIV